MVERIFTEYVAGRGITAIARGLTQVGIPCPSAYDRARNPHRHTQVWETTAIRAILLNPRYTGRQVWNRVRTDEALIDVEDVARAHKAAGSRSLGIPLAATATRSRRRRNTAGSRLRAVLK